MLQTQSVVNVADNTGAKLAKIIRILKGSNAKSAGIGDKVVVAIKDAQKGGQVEDGDISWGVIVRVKKEIKRDDGTYIRFEDNAIALIDKEGKPRGKRIFGPVAKELREKGFKEVANIAEEII